MTQFDLINKHYNDLFLYSKSLQLEHGKPLLVPWGADSMQNIGNTININIVIHDLIKT